ncbi:LysR family transcriptional regulator [Aestuariicella hydrocarbonica]|uniref:LysR family transcriptional regulator n=1 Tax=Pseudomaricurvus hydrocarbonicus TaxID=1470433 RepID=A0A9E5JWU5_9GAMM|nr:LysR family transcriptional regulator [Aestuariicella hydrocarbonica]NHO66370.1 LysR family transcriptional regulator [Aestuariicella hydrocarbonica]
MTRKGSSISPELLELFVMIAQHGSIASAARVLNMSPSLATRKIAKLESALSTRLFERTTRNMKITEAGSIALEWARRSQEAQSKMLDEIAVLQKKPSGLIRLVATQYAASEFLPFFLARFCAEYPLIRLSITTTDTLVNLIEDDYDLAVHAGRIPDCSLIAKPLQPFERVLCATPAYLKRRGYPLSPEALEKHDCLVHFSDEPRSWNFLFGKELVGQSIEPFVEANSYAVLLNMARESMGIARLGKPLVKDDIAAGRLVELMPEYRCVYSNEGRPCLWLLYPNRHVLNRTRLLIDFLQRHVEPVQP